MQHQQALPHQRVAILEDTEPLRKDFERLITAEPQLSLAGSFACLEDAEALFQSPPSILLADLLLPDGTAHDLITRLRRETETRIIVISVLGDEQAVVSAIAAGAHSYLLKGATGFELRDAIFQVLAGHLPISPAIARYVMKRFSGPTTAEGQASLTSREREVLVHLAKGLTDKETARALDISPHTIADHLRSIFRKLDVSSRTAAVVRAIARGDIVADAGDEP